MEDNHIFSLQMEYILHILVNGRQPLFFLKMEDYLNILGIRRLTQKKELMQPKTISAHADGGPRYRVCNLQ